MGFEVRITDAAFADLDVITGFVRQQASIAVARRWFSRMMDAIATLQEMPGRCSLAPEAEVLGEDIRLLLHGKKNRAYKIYFRIRQQTQSSGVVQVFHVRHWARRPLSKEEILELGEDF